MKIVTYVVTDPQGIHVRPAGLLVKQIAEFKSNATIARDGKEADAKKIIGLMSLGVKKGEKISITFEGEDEAAAAAAVEKFLKENL